MNAPKPRRPDYSTRYPPYLYRHCRASDKPCYSTVEECERSCRRIEQKRQMEPNTLRPYWCQICETFHVTSKPVGFVESRQDPRHNAPRRIWQPAVTGETRDQLLELKRQLEQEG